jgi:hypothetical protein
MATIGTRTGSTGNYCLLSVFYVERRPWRQQHALGIETANPTNSKEQIVCGMAVSFIVTGSAMAEKAVTDEELTVYCGRLGRSFGLWEDH